MAAIVSRASDKPGKGSSIAIFGQHEIAGLLEREGIGLHLTNNGDCSAAVGPAAIDARLFGRRIAPAVAKRVRHGGLDQPIGEANTAVKRKRTCKRS